MTPLAPLTILTQLDLSGCRTVAIGGFVNHRKPLRLLRTLAAAQPDWSPDTLVCLSGSVDLDLALALWPGVRTLHAPFQGVEGLATISPGVQARLQACSLTAPVWDTGILCQALGARPGEVVTTLTGVGTDLPALNPWLKETATLLQVTPLPVDLALLHLPYATPVGAPWYDDSPWGDGLLFEVATRVIATVGAARDPIGNARVYPPRDSATLVELVDPCWPTAEPPVHEADLSVLRALIGVSRDDATGRALLDWWAESDSGGTRK